MISLRTTSAALVLGLAALAGCGSDSEADDASPAATDVPASEAASTEPPATEPAATEPPATEPVATEPPATEPAATEPPADTAAPVTEPPADGPECLVGDWIITEAEMNAYYDALEAALAAEAGTSPTIDVAGNVGLQFTPTDYTYTGNFDLTLAVAGQEGNGTSTGTVAGTWSGDDGVIVTELGESDLTVSVSIGGITLDGSDLANGLLNDLPINAAPYDCEGPSLEFRTGAGTPRHTVTLTPA